jgi:hypothetical protein
MKKSLIFWLAAVTCAAWILVGCEQEAETKTVTATNGAAADIAGLNKLLDEGVSPIRYVGDLAIGTNTVLIPAGVTVNVDGGVTVGADGVFVVAGNLSLGAGKGIAVTAPGGTVVGGTEVTDKVTGAGAVTGSVTGTVAEATAAFTTKSVVLVTGAVGGEALTLAAVPSGKTLYVGNTLTLGTTAPAPSGAVVALGKVDVTATVDVSSIVDDSPGNGKLTLTGATLTNSAAADVTLPTSATVKSIAVGSADLTITGVTGGLTVGSITNGGGNLKLATASSIIKQAGDDTTGTFTFGAAANQVLVKPALADSTLTLGGATTLVGVLSLGDTAKVELGAGATLTTTFTDEITVGDSGGTFTPAGAGVTFPADTVFDGATKTVTLGSAGLTIGGSTTSFAVNVSGILKGNIVLADGDDTVTLDKAVITGAASAAVTFTTSGAAIGLLADTSLALEDGGSIAFTGAGVVNSFSATPITLSGGAFTNNGDTLTLTAASAATATLTGATLTKLTLGTGATIAIPAEANTGLVLTGVIVDLSTAGQITIANDGKLLVGAASGDTLNNVAGIITRYNGTGNVVIAGGKTSGDIAIADNVTAFNSKADYAALKAAISPDGVGIQGVFTGATSGSKNFVFDKDDTFELDASSPNLKVAHS